MPHPDFKPLSLMSASPVAAASPGPWTPLPWADLPRFDVRSVLAHWLRLHAGHGDAPDHGCYGDNPTFHGRSPCDGHRVSRLRAPRFGGQAETSEH